MPKKDIRKKKGIGIYARPFYIFDEQLPSGLSDALRVARSRVKIAHVGKRQDGFEFVARKGTEDTDLLRTGGILFTRDPEFKRANRHPNRDTCVVILQGRGDSVPGLLALIAPLVRMIERSRWVYHLMLGRRFLLSHSSMTEIDEQGRRIQSFDIK